MDACKMEKDAKSAASKHIINMLQRPGQLEKVTQHKRRIERKKASVETMLKTAMQSQLDGIKVGFDQLRNSGSKIQDFKKEVDEIQKMFKIAPTLSTRLSAVQFEHMRHSQYVTAKENLKHIFNVPESIEKTKQWINESKLLHAHQCLMDLENSRDDLLFELHKLPNEKPADKIMLKAYFEDIQELSDKLEKQIRLILSRTINTVRKEPTVIVTVLRIIEREEKADCFAVQRHKQSGFMPPGRPKKWKEKAFEVLEKSVVNRIEGTHIDQRENDKMWLVKYLELTRLLILEDIRVIKTLCIPCFPPSYDILNKFVNMYHSNLSQHLKDIIADGLEGNEYVSLLSWVMNTYYGPDLMGHPEINVKPDNLGFLLDKQCISMLEQKYLDYMLQNYEDWMTKTLETEKIDWSRKTPPEGTLKEVYYQTAAPIIIFQMIGQNLQVTKTVSEKLTALALKLCIEQIIKYAVKYREAMMEFKSKHFEDRSKVPFFTQHVIIIVNNCLKFIELAQQMKNLYWISESATDTATKFEQLITEYSKLRDDAVAILLEESFLDLEAQFAELLTTKWLTSNTPIETIRATLTDYFNDYSHLSPKNFEHVSMEAQNLIAKRYITAMLSRKICLKTYEECLVCSTKILSEIEKLKQFFLKITPQHDLSSPFDVITHLSEVLKCEDSEILALDLHSLTEKYPDITEDHLIRLLNLRGDISRSEAKEKVKYIFEVQRNRDTYSNHSSIFKQIVFQDSFLNWKS